MADHGCVVCAEDLSDYAIGHCNHHSCCAKCILRMRERSKNSKCPICQVELKSVIVTSSGNVSYDELKAKKLIPQNPRIPHCDNVSFSSSALLSRYNRLRLMQCPICAQLDTAFVVLGDKSTISCEKYAKTHKNELEIGPNGFPKVYSDPKQLAEHMKAHHSLKFCELCLVNSRWFVGESLVFDDAAHDEHVKTGLSAENGPLGNWKGFMGHPICEFCDVRMYNSDDLYKHLNNTHFHCHCCSSPGEPVYYADLVTLEMHYEAEHFPCPYGECVAKKHIVFRTEEERNAHYRSTHSGKFGQFDRNKAKQLDVQFQIRREGRYGQGTEDDLPAASTSSTFQRPGGAQKDKRFKNQRVSRPAGGQQDMPNSGEPELPTASRGDNNNHNSNNNNNAGGRDKRGGARRNNNRDDDSAMPNDPTQGGKFSLLSSQAETERDQTPGDAGAGGSSGGAGGSRVSPARGVQAAPAGNPEQEAITARNRGIMQVMMDALGSARENEFKQFREASANYRNGGMSVQDFYLACEVIFGPEFAQIFIPAINELQPDQAKKRELQAYHESQMKLNNAFPALPSKKPEPEKWGKKKNSARGFTGGPVIMDISHRSVHVAPMSGPAPVRGEAKKKRNENNESAARKEPLTPEEARVRIESLLESTQAQLEAAKEAANSAPAASEPETFVIGNWKDENPTPGGAAAGAGKNTNNSSKQKQKQEDKPPEDFPALPTASRKGKDAAMPRSYVGASSTTFSIGGSGTAAAATGGSANLNESEYPSLPRSAAPPPSYAAPSSRYASNNNDDAPLGGGGLNLAEPQAKFVPVKKKGGKVVLQFDWGRN